MTESQERLEACLLLGKRGKLFLSVDEADRGRGLGRG